MYNYTMPAKSARNANPTYRCTPALRAPWRAPGSAAAPLIPLRENHMDDMRDWLKDCVWADMDSADVNDLSDSAILRGINRHYDGGVDQFRADAGEAR